MATPLTAAETKNYTAVIDAILATANLETVTRKKVRQGLEKALGKDLSDQKDAIKSLIEARFDAINSQTQSSGTMLTPPLAPTADELVRPSPKRGRSELNGHDVKEEEDDKEEINGEIQVSVEEPPVKKKKKQKRDSASYEDADARLAAALQAEENRLARSRSTRGGGVAKPSKPVKKAKTPRKKSAAKIKGEDDSDIESSEANGATKRKAGGGFQKPFALSYALGDLVGETQLSRPQVVKKIWEHIKANELQDPNDRRQIRCDEKMQAIFKAARVDMFQMNKLLGNHLYPVEE